MNYLEIYKGLIETRKLRVVEDYTEKHHVIPKSINSSKFICSLLCDYNKDDVVNLTGREHYIAHALLVKITKHNRNCYLKMLHAWNLMRAKGPYSKIYNIFKEEYSHQLSNDKLGKPSGAKGKKWSEEAKQRRKDSHYMTGKTYEEIYGDELASQYKEVRRYERSSSTKEKLSAAAKIRSADPLYIEKLKKPKSESHKEKMKESAKLAWNKRKEKTLLSLWIWLLFNYKIYNGE